jgi:hypothetical protein
VLDLVLPEVIRVGVSRVEVWTKNTTTRRPRQMTDFGLVWAIMERVKAGGVRAVHAEDERL